MKSVLIVEDEAPVRSMVARMLADASFDSHTAESVDEALAQLREREFDVVLSDVRMPGKTGLDLVQVLRSARPHTPVVLMTGYASIDSAVESMRRGAFDYLTKPFKRDPLVMSLERAIANRDLEREDTQLPTALNRSEAAGSLIGSSPALRGILALIARIADKSSTVLITGESGTGKERVAQAIHFTGGRASGRFVPVNCSAIPEGLLASELFGHRRGAFTGAVESRPGVFELAHEGTLFLDEIGDMGLDLQSKLLRVLEDQEVRPVGGMRSTKVDVRIVAATNKDLAAEMARGRFRRDLFYRLNVIPIRIPPLRDRPEDIRTLAQFLVRQHSEGARRRLSEEALERLVRLPWEGNVRELRNVIERALTLTDHEELGAEDLEFDLDSQPPGDAVEPREFVRHALESQMTLRDIEDLVIRGALESTGGNMARAAKLLGVSRRTLYRRESPPDAPPRAGSSPRRAVRSE